MIAVELAALVNSLSPPKTRKVEIQTSEKLASQTLLCIQVTRGSRYNADSESVVLGQGWTLSDKHPGGTGAAGLRITACVVESWIIYLGHTAV